MRVCVHRGLNIRPLTANRKKAYKSSGNFTVPAIAVTFCSY